ncbi:glycosyltransferase family 4 protein [Modicisalibacter luteus]|uniref:Glycosyltransferase family 4 protein n=1 Tax=Modicisalibacter luteus TaxID=453962 RepID=A0ABV7LZD5_9GAMM|nr:glycosyltransferase family 4 protein [Halomonas lutea]GHA96881.1 glycosyl transferase [Halomonas lutea]
MKIAQVPPLTEAIPPKQYGGTERVVSYLTEELVALGHDVTLFASGDSQTSATLVPLRERSLRTDSSVIDRVSHLLAQIDTVLQRAGDFDVIHFHTDYHAHFLPLRYLDVPHLTTLHGRLDIADAYPLFARFPNEPLVSISNHQRLPLKNVNWLDTVYHGLPETLYRLNEAPGDYLAFIGRFSPEKAPHTAIEIALRTGTPIRIAAKPTDSQVDEEYFNTKVRPLLSHPLVDFIGEIGEREKNDFLGNAKALLFPITWPEPFGLVMIEAMACGTPVIAFRQGSVPEVMQEGVSGFVVDDVEQAIAALDQLDNIDRRACRQYFEQRFSASTMARNYVHCYERLLDSGNGPRGNTRLRAA